MPKDNMMRAVQIGQDHKVSIIETGIPQLLPDEVLVKPGAGGICGTDLHILHHGFPGTKYPVIPIHEFAGHVVAVGQDVTKFKEGDFVAVDPNVTCGTCRWCASGRPNLCANLTPTGVARPGAAAEFVAVPARNTFPVSTELSPAIAALIEPLACVLHAISSSEGVKGRSVAVLGGGTMGFLASLVASQFGAERVLLSDPVTGKREIATAAGIREAISPNQLGTEKFDVVIEAVGLPQALAQAFQIVEKTGVLVQVGVHNEGARFPIDPFKIYEREIKYVGSNSCADKFGQAVDVISDIRDKAALIIGKSYEVWDFEKASEHMSAGESIKTQLVF